MAPTIPPNPNHLPPKYPDPILNAHWNSLKPAPPSVIFFDPTLANKTITSITPITRPHIPIAPIPSPDVPGFSIRPLARLLISKMSIPFQRVHGIPTVSPGESYTPLANPPPSAPGFGTEPSIGARSVPGTVSMPFQVVPYHGPQIYPGLGPVLPDGFSIPPQARSLIDQISRHGPHIHPESNSPSSASYHFHGPQIYPGEPSPRASVQPQARSLPGKIWNRLVDIFWNPLGVHEGAAENVIAVEKRMNSAASRDPISTLMSNSNSTAPADLEHDTPAYNIPTYLSDLTRTNSHGHTHPSIRAHAHHAQAILFWTLIVVLILGCMGLGTWIWWGKGEMKKRKKDKACKGLEERRDEERMEWSGVSGVFTVKVKEVKGGDVEEEKEGKRFWCC